MTKWIKANILKAHQCFCCLHSDHPGTIADHVADLPKSVINQSDLLIGRRDGHNADWTENIGTTSQFRKLQTHQFVRGCFKKCKK